MTMNPLSDHQLMSLETSSQETHLGIKPMLNPHTINHNCSNSCGGLGYGLGGFSGELSYGDSLRFGLGGYDGYGYSYSCLSFYGG